MGNTTSLAAAKGSQKVAVSFPPIQDRTPEVDHLTPDPEHAFFQSSSHSFRYFLVFFTLVFAVLGEDFVDLDRAS